MKEIMSRALELARLRGAQYADMRVVNNRTESMSVKDGVVEALNFDDSFGFGVRVLADGAWGFASSARLEDQEVDQVTERALEIARASALVSGETVDLGAPVTSRASTRRPWRSTPSASRARISWRCSCRPIRPWER